MQFYQQIALQRHLLAYYLMHCMYCMIAFCWKFR